MFKDTHKVCGRKALQNFRDDMNNQDIQNIKDFVDRGVLIKCGVKTKFRKNLRAAVKEEQDEEAKVRRSRGLQKKKKRSRDSLGSWRKRGVQPVLYGFVLDF